ncbi:PAS domain S-box protein [Bdellovibrio bacteriovorus]|uniref:PAS domain S-box protein n=1 Tax=Bdellovibrio TaxID=958 RepID=UPI0035A90498
MEPSREAKYQQEQRYKTIFDSGMIGIVASTFDGSILDANDYFLKMLGYTRTELQRGELSWVKLTAPEDLERSKKYVDVLIAKGSVASFEKEYLHKDGHRVPAVVALTMFTDGTVIALILDISRRKMIERELEQVNLRLEDRVQQRTQQLRQSEAFLEAIFENIPNMIFVKDAKDLRFVRFNKAGEDLIGVPRSEMIGKNDYDFFPKEQADFFTTKDRDVLNDTRIVDIPEEPIQTAKGIRYLHTKKIPICNKEGQPEYLLGVSEDITEKKEAEKQKMALLQEQVAREEAELRAQQMSFLSDVSSVLSESFDQEKILKNFSRSVINFMADVCVVDLLDEEGYDFGQTEVTARESSEEDYIRAWRSRHPLRWDSPVGPTAVLRSGKSEIHKDFDVKELLSLAFSTEASLEEKPIPISSMIVTPIKIRDQKPLGSVTFLLKNNNFTEMDLSLAEEVSSRLAVALENSRLFYKAQEANRAKSAFLANVSHEIRTPLGAMLGFTEMLKEDASLTSDHKETIETILRNGQQLLRIVDEILDISKVESERIQIEHIAFSLPNLLEDVVLLLKGRAEEKGIELRVSYQNLPEFIVSDPTRLRQILINVIGNAIKFTDEGNVELIVSRKKNLEFRVVDTGIGISPEQKSNLFQPFAQADSSTTRRFGGTGLGLFLSRKLARLLGGDVILDKSVSGKGSTFLITIAFEEASRSEEPRTQTTAEVVDDFKNISGVLIVDDAADNRDLFRRYLRKLGVSEEVIEMAQNGLEAVDKASAKTYTLILMDIQMPQMDGFQALSELRKKSYKGHVVALTAHAMKGDEEKCLAAGFDGYLQKPLSREALREVLIKTSTRRR